MGLRISEGFSNLNDSIWHHVNPASQILEASQVMDQLPKTKSNSLCPLTHDTTLPFSIQADEGRFTCPQPVLSQPAPAEQALAGEVGLSKGSQPIRCGEAKQPRDLCSLPQSHVLHCWLSKRPGTSRLQARRVTLGKQSPLSQTQHTDRAQSHSSGVKQHMAAGPSLTSAPSASCAPRSSHCRRWSVQPPVRRSSGSPLCHPGTGPGPS